jgi:hypothetical protein
VVPRRDACRTAGAGHAGLAHLWDAVGADAD